MKYEKDDALVMFDDMIKKSWTYARFTKEEKEYWHEVLTNTQTKTALKGTFNQRWAILQSIYASFLFALGYTKNCIDWRGDDMEDAFDCKITYDK